MLYTWGRYKAKVTIPFYNRKIDEVDKVLFKAYPYLLAWPMYHQWKRVGKNEIKIVRWP